MRTNVPGVHVPDPVIDRLEGAKDQKPRASKICIELIQEVREIPGVAGIHVMAYRQEETRRRNHRSHPACSRARALAPGRDAAIPDRTSLT